MKLVKILSKRIKKQFNNNKKKYQEIINIRPIRIFHCVTHNLATNNSYIHNEDLDTFYFDIKNNINICNINIYNNDTSISIINISEHNTNIIQHTTCIRMTTLSLNSPIQNNYCRMKEAIYQSVFTTQSSKRDYIRATKDLVK